MKLAHQDSQNRAVCASRLDVLECRLPTQVVSNHPTLFSGPQHHDHHHYFTKTPFNMEMPRFDGTDALGWTFKIYNFLNFHNTEKNKELQ